MTRIRQMLAVVFVTALTLTGLAGGANAAPLKTLSSQDAQLYAAAFDAAEKGDAATTDETLARVQDPCLVGRVQYLKIMHAKAHTATFGELVGWLKSFGDLPGADRVYALALRLKPAGIAAPAPTGPLLSEAYDPRSGERFTASPQSRAAREAYNEGSLSRALTLAHRAGDAWIAGLAAYRLGAFDQALASFESVATNPGEADWQRAAGAYWAARTAVSAGVPDQAAPFLQIAAGLPDTFYGMIAHRKLELAADPLGNMIAAVTAPNATPALIKANWSGGDASLAQLAQTQPRARRAVALTQLGRPIDAAAELRAGLAEASGDALRALWVKLAFALNPDVTRPDITATSAAPSADSGRYYPTPVLAPAGGYTIDKALVYAISWQESRFDSLAVSPVGAIGLMQLMPPTGASMAGDDSLKADPIPLFDKGKNLQLGQTYINWLMDRAVGYDLLGVIGAYNGGPAMVNRTKQIVGPGADSLLIMESMPYAESRAYVQKVMAAYWSYRRQFGAESPTLDAAASDALVIDPRLDKSVPGEEIKPLNLPAREVTQAALTPVG